jgi:hypothetical protein
MTKPLRSAHVPFNNLILHLHIIHTVNLDLNVFSFDSFFLSHIVPCKYHTIKHVPGDAFV